MKVRLMAGAFLINEDHVLMLQRNADRKIAPGMWSCVGGHMEPDEIKDPLAACLREVGEEAGIPAGMISGLELRYVTTRNTGEEIRIGFYFFGGICQRLSLPGCDEGTLHWVPMREMIERPMSFSVKEVVAHCLNHRGSDEVFLCAINRKNDGATFVKI
jgi:8-oxo-dGTP diphosphatase